MRTHRTCSLVVLTPFDTRVVGSVEDQASSLKQKEEIRVGDLAIRLNATANPRSSPRSVQDVGCEEKTRSTGSQVDGDRQGPEVIEAEVA